MNTPPQSSPKIWRATFAYLVRALRRNFGGLLIIVVGGVAAGYIATMKSFIESAVFSAFVEGIETRKLDLSGVPDFPDLAEASGFDKVSRWLQEPLTGLNMGGLLPVYILVTVVGAIVGVLTALSRADVARSMYADLYRVGVRRAFTSGAVEDDDEPGGLGVSIHAGAQAVSSAWSLATEAAQYLVSFILVVAVLAGVGLSFAGVSAVIVIACALLSYLQGRHLEHQRLKYDGQRKKLLGFTDDVLTNRDVLLAHERRDAYVDRLRDAAHDIATTERLNSVWEQFYRSSVGVAQDLGLIAFLTFVLVNAEGGTPVDHAGDAYFYVSLFGRLMAPIRSMLSNYDQIRGSLSLSNTLLALIRRTDDNTGSVNPANASDLIAPASAVAFADVSFSYPGGKAILNRCSFTVPTGGVTLVLGPSGSGKTTLCRHILGFLQPNEGLIQVLGRSTRDWDHTELLLAMSYLAQVEHVIQGSVRENLFAAGDATDADMARALHDAGLASSQTAATDLLEEDALELSLGQKQRLALARILIDTAPVVVLDEPLAGVDVFTFAAVHRQLARWLRDPARTVVLVSHRLAFASSADHIVVLNRNGSVAEEGPPEQLLHQPGSVFAHLLQTARDDLQITD